MMAFNTNYKDTGLFGVYAIAKPDCLDDLAYAIMYEMSKLCYRVSEVDVTRACNQLKSSLLLHIEGTNPVAEDIGRQKTQAFVFKNFPSRMNDRHELTTLKLFISPPLYLYTANGLLASGGPHI
ncbi:hypothetical protein CsSME_00021426 [Camellia sinensis var. sinensis]